MILKLEMILSVVFYGRKTIIFYEKNLKLTENYTFNNFLRNRTYHLFLPIFKK